MFLTMPFLYGLNLVVFLVLQTWNRRCYISSQLPLLSCRRYVLLNFIPGLAFLFSCFVCVCLNCGFVLQAQNYPLVLQDLCLAPQAPQAPQDLLVAPQVR